MALRAHASPVGVQLGQPVVRLEIGFEVRQVHVVVAVGQQRVAQRSKDAGLVAAEIIGEDQVQRGPGFGLVVIMPVRIIPAAAALHLIGGQAEQKEVFLAGFLRHLDRRAIARADRQRPVHHEFHVARAAGFVAGGRDLVRDIGGRDQPLGERNAIFGQEHDLEAAAHTGSPSIVPARLLMNLMISLASR